MTVWRANRRQLKRARAAGVRAVRVDRLAIFERDGWVCQLCGEAVDPAREFPDPLSPSLDHVIPLDRGGAHVPENCQLAHFGCNASKGSRRTAPGRPRRPCREVTKCGFVTSEGYSRWPLKAKGLEL